MTPQLKLIWHLFNLCAIGFAFAVRGSTGFSIFLSKETSSAFPPAEVQNLGYIHSAAPFSNGSVVQPPLTSHPFESSPPGPENIQPFPQLPYPVTISPTHSVAASAPTDKSPAPDPSIKLAPGIPSRDLTLQQPAASPEFLAPLPPDPEVPSHGLAPQNPAQVYASPPVVAPQASVSIHASSPASTAVPSHFPSLPPSTISPPPFLPSKNASAPSKVALPSHTVGQGPSAFSPHASTTPTHPKTLHNFTSLPPFVPIENTPSSDSVPPPSVTVPPVPSPIRSPVLVPPPTEKSHFLAPPPTSMPFISAQSPLVSSSPPQAAPSHAFAPSHFSAPPPSSIPYISAPPPNATVSEHSLAPPPPTPPMLASNPPPDVGPPIVSPPPTPDAAPSHDLAPSHFLAPPPSSVPYISAPPPNATLSEHSPAPPMHASNPPPVVGPPIVSPPPPPDAAPLHDPSHFLAPPPSSVPYISAPPPNATVSEHSPAPLMHMSNPPPDAGPPIVSPPPPDAAPSHDLAPPPASMHFPTPPTSSFASKNASNPTSASAPSTVASPPSFHKATPGSLPPAAHQIKKPKSQSPPEPSRSSAPSVASPVRSPSIIPVVPGEPPSIPPEPQLPRVSSPAPSIRQRGHQVPVTVPPSGPTYSLSPTNHHPEQGISPYIAPSIHKSRGLPSLAPKAAHNPSFSPSPSTTKPHARNVSQSAPETSSAVPSPAPQQHGQVDRPYSLLAPSPESTQRYHSPTSRHTAFAPSHPPSTEDYISPIPSGHSMTPFLSPEISPSTRKPMLAPPILALPPPPPNRDCLSYTCLEPYTNTIAGSPCGCVLPMKVELQIGVALYTFFPLVPELAREVATGIFMKQSQVRIMGANAASEQPDKTLLLIDLVPLGDKFDNITAFLIYERFWNKQVAISNSLFGDYQVLNVQYPGLPPSPPMAPSDISVNNGNSYPGGNGSKMHPLGVDVTKQGRKHRLSGSLIAIIVLSAVGSLLLCFLLGWISLFRHRRRVNRSAEAPHVYPSSVARSTGPAGQSAGSRPSFSLSFESSVAAYTGSAKTFSAAEIEKATENFNSSRVLGEGGFGRVYRGDLEDGTEVAVKVLKRDDQQGGREFLAEVEMLSRLHHRNLVKLIGICVEEHARCLVYELVPNGSVESHLHGIDKQISPLDWAARMKIALGAARGLAYLHEDSSPRVIHRDFKASNILLEADFTSKVSDFGLARTAMDEENTHISTRVMGTFGYVAPEYAMTGHLLVKSDVYSYGVVLLELLTGRKPVDMSQPPGQENLVSWTRPYLTSKEALKSIVDPDLGPDISFDSVAKVAAIASMCVQPEVSHRPFMGEVVQALKLVCNECDSSKDECDENSSSCCDGTSFNEARDPSRSRNGEDLEKGLSKSDIFSATDVASESFRRHSSSGPIGGGRSWRFWKRARTTTTTREDVGEHGMYRFWSGSH